MQQQPNAPVQQGAGEAVPESGVYAIRNRVTGRQYVGSAVHLGNRFCRHRWELARGTHHSQKLQRAWTKYGAGAFEFKVLLHCAPKDLLFYEQIILDGFGTARHGYNVLPGAGSHLGRKRSPETRKKLSALNKGRKHSPEFSEMRRQVQTGKPRTEETKAKIAAAMRGRTLGARAVQSLRDRQATPETRAKISASVTRIWAERKAAKEARDA